MFFVTSIVDAGRRKEEDVMNEDLKLA